MTSPDAVVNRLVAQHGDALVHYAYLLTQNAAEAQDLVQDALVKTFVRLRTDVDVSSAQAYVRQTILRLYIDTYRRRMKWLGLRHLVGSPEAQSDVSTEGHLDLQSALGSLTAQERAAVVLRFYEDLTVSEVANQMGLSIGTVKRYLHNAMPKLAAALSPAISTGGNHA